MRSNRRIYQNQQRLQKLMSGQIKFEQAKKKLNSSLEELEDLILSKIPETNVKKEVEDLKEEVLKLKEDNAHKDELIKNLDNELNSLQESMAELGQETEILHHKNKTLTAKYQQREEERQALLEEIVQYVNQIEILVSHED